MMYAMMTLAVVCDATKRKRGGGSGQTNVMQCKRRQPGSGRTYEGQAGNRTQAANPGGDPHGNYGHTMEIDGENATNAVNRFHVMPAPKKKIIEVKVPSCKWETFYNAIGQEYSKGDLIRFFYGGNENDPRVGKCYGYYGGPTMVKKGIDGKDEWLNNDTYLVEYSEFGYEKWREAVPAAYIDTSFKKRRKMNKEAEAKKDEEKKTDLAPIDLNAPAAPSGFWSGARPIEPETPGSPCNFEEAQILRRARMGQRGPMSPMRMRQGVNQADKEVVSAQMYYQQNKLDEDLANTMQSQEYQRAFNNGQDRRRLLSEAEREVDRINKKQRLIEYHA